jgi:hypothetical protein
MQFHLHADEWGFEIERTQIHECYAMLENKRIDAPPAIVLDDSTLKAATEDLFVASKRTVKLFQKYSEIRRINDEINILFDAPTLNPEIHVSALESIKHVVSFGPTDPKVEQDTYGARYVLPRAEDEGTLVANRRLVINSPPPLP